MTQSIPQLPELPRNLPNVTRRIRACESEVPAQLVLEHAMREYALAALAAHPLVGVIPDWMTDEHVIALARSASSENHYAAGRCVRMEFTPADILAFVAGLRTPNPVNNDATGELLLATKRGASDGFSGDKNWQIAPYPISTLADAERIKQWLTGSMPNAGLEFKVFTEVSAAPQPPAGQQDRGEALRQVLDEGLRLVEGHELVSKTTQAYNWTEKARRAIAQSIAVQQDRGEATAAGQGEVK